MEAVCLRGVWLGKGRPKVCVSLDGPDSTALLAGLRAARANGAEVVEWRADAFRAPDEIPVAARALRAAAEDIPLLFTWRTAAEGGTGTLTTKDYIALNCRITTEKCADAVDVELRTGEDAVRAVVRAAHQNGVAAIVSSHHFEGTPTRMEMAAQLEQMAALGDLPKLAVMPHTFEDVLALMDAVHSYTQKARAPAIAMAMGQLGRISRVAGQFFGSVLTFGCVGQPSAPGQMPAAQLAAMLDTLAADDVTTTE